MTLHVTSNQNIKKHFFQTKPAYNIFVSLIGVRIAYSSNKSFHGLGTSIKCGISRQF